MRDLSEGVYTVSKQRWHTEKIIRIARNWFKLADLIRFVTINTQLIALGDKSQPIKGVSKPLLVLYERTTRTASSNDSQTRAEFFVQDLRWI